MCERVGAGMEIVGPTYLGVLTLDIQGVVPCIVGSSRRPPCIRNIRWYLTNSPRILQAKYGR
jgi:hypothetical protein